MKLSDANERKVKELEREIKKVERAKDALDEKKDALEDKIQLLQIGESPIQPGHVIAWESGNRMRRGKVISVSAGYRRWGEDYTYRCQLLNKKNQVIGIAKVDSDRLPLIESKMDKESKSDAR